VKQALNPQFKKIQHAFTQHIRDPENNPAPTDIESRRMDIYRELVYSNVENFMANSFPVLRKITPDEQWHAMIRDYLKIHLARTPLFPKMPQEFLQYLQNERLAQASDYPFLQELAHYEWLELALSLDAREINWDGIERQGDLLEGIPVLSPLAMPMNYRYPVHRISPEFQPVEPPEQPTYLVVYRGLDYQVGFMELNPVSAKLLELIQKDQDMSGRSLLKNIAIELEHPNPNVVIQGGVEIMQKLRDKYVLLGTLRH